MSGENKTNKLRVITVDDSPVIAERLRSILNEILGVELIGNAYNYYAALYLIQQEKPDVIILDINLSERSLEANGINLLFTIKEKYPKIKTIMLTNLTASFYKTICMDKGVDHFFDKSNEFHQVSEVIKEYRNAALVYKKDSL